ncbi:MAG: hypothetical protein EHM58_19730 [Ignavibacteriae bacterium]|nr:MAG: hypothetical protein EHM58_19730 [Ignavibacteriota bacterium]
MLNKLWFLLIIILIIFSGKLLSQTFPCDISYKDGRGIYKTRMIGLHQDLLLVSDTGSYKIVNVEKISRIRFDNGTYLWTGVGVGAAVGFISGILYYELFGGKNRKTVAKDATLGISLVFTLPGSLIGGFVGNFFRNIDDYDLNNMHPYMKAKEIKYIMKDHAIWK